MKPIICAIEKEVNGRLDTVTTTLFIEALNLWLNLCSFKLLRPTLRRARGVILSGLCYLKVLYCLFNIYFLKDSKLAEPQIFKSSLFHSFITDGKTSF